ncbi:hypothetical protein GEMRC1_008911 [Eukaryota sp. GEM-RC1]
MPNISQKQINWHDFNYPPGLRLVHVNIQELDEPKRSAASLAHYTFLGTVLGLLFNLLSNFIMMFGITKGWVFFLHSFFVFSMVASIALYVFFSGFRALGFSSPSKAVKYLILQLSLVVVYLLFAISDYRNFQGGEKLGHCFRFFMEGVPTYYHGH